MIKYYLLLGFDLRLYSESISGQSQNRMKIMLNVVVPDLHQTQKSCTTYAGFKKLNSIFNRKNGGNQAHTCSYHHFWLLIPIYLLMLSRDYGQSIQSACQIIYQVPRRQNDTIFWLPVPSAVRQFTGPQEGLKIRRGTSGNVVGIVFHPGLIRVN